MKLIRRAEYWDKAIGGRELPETYLTRFSVANTCKNVVFYKFKSPISLEAIVLTLKYCIIQTLLRRPLQNAYKGKMLKMQFYTGTFYLWSQKM